jgi:HAD superfamily hydrolase (TIGR01458 family)
LDLDGTLYQDDRPVPGAPEAVGRLRAAGVPLRFVTNTTRLPRRALHERLVAMGFAAALDEVFTAPLAAAAWLRGRRLDRVALCLPPATHEDFAGFTLTETRPQAVVVGDLGAAWTFERLNRAFRWLLDGAALVAIQKGRYWKSGGELVLDAGPFVAALEYASGTDAVLAGKPAAEFYAAAVEALGLVPGSVAMVGDDAAGDASGARRAGCIGVLVRTGKYRPGDESRPDPAPHAVLDSVARLPEWLDR